MHTSGPLPLSSHGKPIDSFAQASELENELKRAVRGEVRFDRGSRALYATDGSNYRQIPIGLVVPRDREDVIERWPRAGNTVLPCWREELVRVWRGSAATSPWYWISRST